MMLGFVGQELVQGEGVGLLELEEEQGQGPGRGGKKEGNRSVVTVREL